MNQAIRFKFCTEMEDNLMVYAILTLTIS